MRRENERSWVGGVFFFIPLKINKKFQKTYKWKKISSLFISLSLSSITHSLTHSLSHSNGKKNQTIPLPTEHNGLRTHPLFHNGCSLLLLLLLPMRYHCWYTQRSWKCYEGHLTKWSQSISSSHFQQILKQAHIYKENTSVSVTYFNVIVRMNFSHVATERIKKNLLSLSHIPKPAL